LQSKTYTQFLLGKRTSKREKDCQNSVENLYMLAPKIERKTQNTRTCKIEPKKCEKRKHRNPCQKPSTLAHFDSPWKKRGSLLKKTHNKKNFVILVERRAFSRETKKNSLEKCCKLFIRAQNSLMLLPNSRNTCHTHA
jgi:hypothetical protein